VGRLTSDEPDSLPTVQVDHEAEAARRAFGQLFGLYLDRIERVLARRARRLRAQRAARRADNAK
jgi:hypothetical protein